MTDFELYVLVLCLIVFVLMSSLSIIAVVTIFKLTVKLIHSGAEDAALLEEKKKAQKENRRNKIAKVTDFTLSLVLCVVFAVATVISLCIQLSENTYWDTLPTYRVVRSGSMEKKHEENRYLFENNINNHIHTFDLIATHKIPGEYELELYDIVVYEVDDVLLVHRIVEIEEPNEVHPDCRHFVLQGDAVRYPDRIPVLYTQMRGIYTGYRIPFAGSFILFLQSPAGWMCMLLALFTAIMTPIMERKIQREKELRLAVMEVNALDEKEEAHDENWV